MSPRIFALPLIVAGLLVAQPGVTQTYSTVPQPQSDADALGAAMRTLATSPQNIDALITAGELSLRLGDASGAAALFARADKVDPRNGRVKAGMAAILVHEERPGEALRYFNMAEGYGLPSTRFAAERGLAYDLVGEQERAQRDYRMAMASGANDEVVRRYGLSLGISGKQQAALEQLDTLIRKGDRGAWRARAFVLAMNGDVAGANKIATTMMPPGMAQGLGPFFQRLPTLSATDRAFAVHYGETRPTPERLADARMVPALPPLTPEPGAATMLAAAQPVRTVTPSAADDRKARRNHRDRVETAAIAPVVNRTPIPQPTPPVYAAATVQPLPGYPSAATPASAPLTLAQRAPTPAAIPVPRQSAQTTAPANSLAMLSGRSTQPIPFTRTAAAPTIITRSATTVAPVTAVASPSAALPATTRLANAAPPTANMLATGAGLSATSGISSATAAPSTAPTVAAVTPPAGASIVGSPSRPVIAALTPAPAPATPSTASVPTNTPVAAALPSSATIVPSLAPAGATTRSAPTVLAAVSTPSGTPTRAAAAAPRIATITARPAVSPSRATGESSLASIIAGISVPASELAVPPPATPLMPRATRTAVARAAIGVRTTATTPKPVAATEDDAPQATDRRRDKSLAAVDAPKAATDRRKGRAADETDAADRKAAKLTPAEKRAADKKALADKAAADERKAAKSEPERIWVQVAGGANESDLDKAWRAQQGKTAALKGRAAYSTPLRATNRVVTGPFKTDAEARAFVNQLAKQGVSAFPFTSEKGQKMTKLSTK